MHTHTHHLCLAPNYHLKIHVFQRGKAGGTEYISVFVCDEREQAVDAISTVLMPESLCVNCISVASPATLCAGHCGNCTLLFRDTARRNY